jgi:hypothetical protein
MNRTILPLAIVAAVAVAASLKAEEAQPAATPSATAPDATGSDSGYRPLLEQIDAPERNEFGFRFGWWAAGRHGDLTKVGEFADIDSSPFWDVDGLFSNGERTLDFFASGLDREGNQTGLKYFGPRLQADFEFQRYLRRLDHVPLDNFLGVFRNNPTFAPDGTQLTLGALNRTMQSQDLNVGDEYAIRVEEISAGVEGRVTDNIKYRVRAWGMRKFGERQVNALSHCFNGALTAPGVPTSPAVPAGARACHVLSRRQQIDWLTEEVEPSLEGRWGPVTVEYSRLMRAFYQDDQLLERNYTSNDPLRAIGAVGDGVGGTAAGKFGEYAVTPENVTQIDRIKMGIELPMDSNFYSNLFAGNTRNRIRDTERKVTGVDLRLANHSLERLTVSTYLKNYSERNDRAPFLRPDEIDPLGGSHLIDQHHPWDYDRTTTGLESRWRPIASGYWRGLAITSGYEFQHLDRTESKHEAHALQVTPPTTATYEVGSTFYHTAKVGTEMRWSQAMNSYVRYTHQWINNPMFAVHEPNGVSNTNLPDEIDLVQLGNTWMPWNNLMLSGWVGIENRNNSSSWANFEEDDYPFGSTIWYAPTPKWSFSAGYAWYSNWISQDITMGDQVGGFQPGGRIFLDPVTSRFSYGGHAQVITLGSSYAVTERVILSSGIEFSRSRDVFDPLTLWPDLPTFSDILVETTRYNVGVDWQLRERISCYWRYIYLDYEDETVAYNSGTAHMLLTGVSAIY